MNKKIVLFIILFAGAASIIFATDQIFFDSNAGIYFYLGFGGKAGWMHYWENDKIGFIGDVCYYNNGFVDEIEGDWQEEIKKAHNIGIGAGVVFNNMGMNGVLRTSEYIQIRGVYQTWGKPSFYPYLDAGFKLSVFFTNMVALSAGIGLEMVMIPYPYFSLGMVFALQKTKK